MSEPTITLAAYRGMVEVLLSYVPRAQREIASAAALAVGIGYAYPPKPPKPTPVHKGRLG